jgi:hypothetical protein
MKINKARFFIKVLSFKMQNNYIFIYNISDQIIDSQLQFQIIKI